jgi:serine/threonine-protein kinase
VSVPEDRARADALLCDALDRPEAEREAFVRAACAGDTALKSHVLTLLRAAASGSAGLAPGGALAGPFGHGLLGRLDGGDVRMGPFRIAREIGRGGMGVVYLAERVEGGFAQQVALKIAAPGTEAEAVARRFERERRMVAALDHPNIARLVDGGRTEDGRPYFAMEFVDGERIDRFCDGARLGIEERLRLVRTVAAAVQHAHAKLVVHRDIKPGNVLISRNGAAKLLDFGIAKPIGPETDGGDEPLTRTGVRPMTPEYASPEQVRGEPVTTASDVYQIGLLLYELLTGVRAQALDGASATEAERIVCRDDPPPPSAAARGLRPRGTHPEARARARGTTPAALSRRLAGDLDAIVLKAIRKEPEQRYPTPHDLIEDLDRFLTSQPVRARRGTSMYLARKFVQRHRAATVFVAVIVALVAGFGASMGVLYGRASANLVRARAAESSAAWEAETAQQVSDFLVRLFAVSDPGESRGNTVTARELLDQAAHKIDRELATRPELQARMLEVIGGVYTSLGLFGQAEPLLERALEIRRRVLGDEHRDTLASISDMGELLSREGKLGEAERYQREALEERRRTLGGDDQDTLTSINNMGTLFRDQGKLDEAEPYLREALEGRRRVLGNDHTDTMTSISNLSSLLRDRGKLEEAEPYHREALEGYRRVLGNDHPDTLIAINNMGLLLRTRGKLDEAEPYYREALEGQRRVLGSDHPSTLNSMHNMGVLLRHQSKLDEAEPYLREALAGCRRVLGSDHSLTLTSIKNVGDLLRRQGKLEEAEPYLREALEGARRVLGDDHPITLASMDATAKLYINQRQYEKAEALLEEVLDALGPKHSDTAKTIGSLGTVAALRGDRRRALEFLRQAVEIDGALAKSMAADPLLESLHGDPEFEAILAAIPVE